MTHQKCHTEPCGRSRVLGPLLQSDVIAVSVTHQKCHTEPRGRSRVLGPLLQSDVIAVSGTLLWSVPKLYIADFLRVVSP